MRLIRWILPALAFTLMANHASAQHSVVRATDGGIPVVRTEHGPKYSGPIIEIESELVLGIDEGEPEWQMFASQPRLLVVNNGTMIIVDTEKFEIYIVSESGDLLVQAGGEGSGPGEFKDILDVRDSTVVG